MTTVPQILYVLATQFLYAAMFLLPPFYLLKYRRKHRTAGYFCTSAAAALVLTPVVWTSAAFLSEKAMAAGLCSLSGLWGPSVWRIGPVILSWGLIALFVSFLFRDGWKRKLLTLAAAGGLTMCAAAAAALTGAMEGGIALEPGIAVEGGASLTGGVFWERAYFPWRELAAADIAAFLFNLCFILIYSRMVEKRRRHGAILYVAVPFYQFFMLLVYFCSADKEFQPWAAALGAALIAIGIALGLAVLYVMRGMEQKARQEETLTVLYRQRQNELDYYRTANEHMEQLREMRHDFINQIQTAYLLLRDGRCQERVKRLLDSSYQELVKTRHTVYCEHPVVNALLSMKAGKAEAAGIPFQAECRIGSLEGMEEIDLCSLFGDMLDNALEDCAGFGNGLGGVRLKAVEKGGYEIIRVEIIERDGADTPGSRKDGSEQTGDWRDNGDMSGSRNSGESNNAPGREASRWRLAERICKKYDGELKIRAESDRLCVTAFLSSDKCGRTGDKAERNND